MNLAINRTSWVMKVAQYGGLCADDDRSDLCSLFWAFVWGVVRAPFWVSLLGSIGAGLIWLFVFLPVYALIAYITERLSVDPVVWGVLAIWTVAIWAVYEMWAADEKKAAPIQSTIRFAKAGYRSWKDKTCVMVDLT